MVVLILESVPAGLRGELSKWMLEPKAGVFVGTISGAVRDLLWEKACQEAGQGGCTMIYRAANEQGFAVRSYGDTTRQVEEWEGLFLVRRPNPQLAPPPTEPSWDEMLHAEIWAKSPAPEGGPYHPLICHMIDTAMVTLRLWQYVLPPALKMQITKALNLDAEGHAGRWISLFAGLHDLGKASPVFGKLWPEGWDRLRQAKFGPARDSDEKKKHHVLSTHFLKSLLQKQGIPQQVAFQLARVVGGHHGTFPTAQQLKNSDNAAGQGRWETARENMVRLLAHVLQLDATPPPMCELERENALLLIIAGLTSVADWIASDHTLFPYAGDDVRLPSYARRARWRAWIALHRLGWFQRPVPAEAGTFQELFDKVPNRLQEQILGLTDRLHGPSLVLLEYPMGGGKTEGALYLADYLAATAGQRGAYFALPTMATSNQMFGRVLRYLENRFPGTDVNVQLMHGHADLHHEFQMLRRAGERQKPGELGVTGLVRPGGIGEKEKAPAVQAAEWFTYRKRGLLAPYGIGTIDQALMAILQTKHYFVRLFGLAGKVVILDEVHAYDTYTRTLLSHLLTWLAACGTSVVLLSATLPAHTRQELLSAYAKGRGRVVPAATDPAAYPRLSWVTENGQDSQHITGAPERRVALRRFSQAEDGWMADLRDALADGGCAAVIANTVGRAQEIYQQLQAHLPSDELYLFHARYPFDDRQHRESTVLQRFGPGTADRPHRAVVVATQVIEQSLDLDFDLMVSDLAPVDLLLQRSGRVWRHPRQGQRPARIPVPSLWVLMPQPGPDGVPAFEPGSARVYNRHTLLRTWLALADRPELTIPQQIEELVESVYQEAPEAPADLPAAVRAVWQKTWADLGDAEMQKEFAAMQHYIPPVDGELFGMAMDQLDEEDETLHTAHRAMTRLGGPSVSVVCLTQDEQGRLWAEGTVRTAVHLERRLDLETIRLFLGRSLSIGFAPNVVKAILADAEQPGTWEATAYLRRHRLLRFAPDGTCLTADLPLRLDPDLGLVYIRKGGEES